jgi:hypothetical protein
VRANAVLQQRHHVGRIGNDAPVRAGGFDELAPAVDAARVALRIAIVVSGGRRS